MLLKILGGLAIAYGAANLLAWRLAEVDLGSFITIGNSDYTAMAAFIVGAVLYGIGAQGDDADTESDGK